MTVAQLDEQREKRTVQVFRWRLEQLLRAGYCRRDAGELAKHPDVDLHQAVDLLRNGCPPKLAVQILG